MRVLFCLEIIYLDAETMFKQPIPAKLTRLHVAVASRIHVMGAHTQSVTLTAFLDFDGKCCAVSALNVSLLFCG